MRLAVVSDIHGNLPALLAVWAEIQRESPDAVLNLGDIVSGPLWPRETAQWLMARAWTTIAGNHERQLLDMRRPQAASDAFAAAALGVEQKAWLAGLPARARLDGGVALVHGTPERDHEPLLDTVTPDFGQHGSPGVRAATPAEVAARLQGWDGAGITLLLCGHSHSPRVLALPRPEGELLVVNPGSVGLPAYDHDQPYRHHVETGSPHARWALLEHTAQGWQVQQRFTAYDWRAAARQALANGRPDWCDALLTGRVGRTEAAPG